MRTSCETPFPPSLPHFRFRLSDTKLFLCYALVRRDSYAFVFRVHSFLDIPFSSSYHPHLTF